MPRVMQFENLGRKKAYEEVAEKIREQIFSRHLHLGDRLPTERDLATQFGVSRVAVREAIRTLELGGLLTVKKGPKGGIFVAQDYERPITESIVNLLNGGEATLENLCEIRLLIEPYAAARAAELADDDALARLATSVTLAEQAAEQGHAVRGHNLEFHRQIIRHTGNPILSVIGETVLELLSERIRHISSPEASVTVLKMHRQILRALVARQPATARKVMQQDIQGVGEMLARMQEESGPRRKAER